MKGIKSRSRTIWKSNVKQLFSKYVLLVDYPARLPGELTHAAFM